MRHDQVVGIFDDRPRANIRLDKPDRRSSHRPPRQANHTRAPFNAIDRRFGITPNEFSKKASVPLPHHKHAARTLHLSQERQPRSLQLVTENNSLEPAIRRRDEIEIHRRAKGRMANGVRRTRSASAVRLSRERPRARFSLTSKIALT